jgi:serine/threonine-protein kinase
MTTEDGSTRFRRLDDLFNAALEVAPGEREALVRGATADDPTLGEEVLALLSADDAKPDLTDPVSRAAASLTSEFAESPGGPASPASGRRLGPWRVVRPIGEGGMGTVYLVERADGAFEARAALKLVRGGLPSALLDERLRIERQILASLDHPNIARLLDGGTTEDGTPWLVMEYVEGTPVTTWCEENGASVEARLDLFVQICDAVAAAHAQLVVHHDIKPANILVTPEGQPKLLDFGVARIVDSLDPSATGPTLSLRMMTPAYASPERLLGERAGAAADIYALGVLLYRLLAGRLPLELDGLTPVQMTTRVVTQVPPVLSSVTHLPSRRQLRGDMDAILSRALRKEPEGRYPSVTALTDDLRRHLRGLPVEARRDDWRYRTSKFVRRNLGAVTSGALVTLLLVAFTLTSLVQARNLALERDRAQRERATAERVTDFLTGLFYDADPNSSVEALSARDVVDRGAERVFEGTEGDPELRLSLAATLGGVYRSLGDYERAAPLLDSAVAVGWRSQLDPEALAEAIRVHGDLAYDVGRYEEALARYRSGLPLARAAGSWEQEAELMDGVGFAHAELANLDSAEAASREALAIRERYVEPPDAGLANNLLHLADLARDRGDLDEALRLGEEVLSQMRQLHGSDHLDVASALNHLASTLNRSGRPGEALPYLNEGLAIRRTAYPDGHPEVAASLGNLANTLGSLDRLPEAEAARREALAMLREIFPDGHMYVAATAFSLGEDLRAQGKLDEAAAILQESVQLHRDVLGPDHPNLGYPLTSLGRVLLSRDRPDEAEAVLREAYRVRRDGLGPGHWHVAASGLELGRALDRQSRAAEAEPFLEESHRLLHDQFGPGDGRTVQARTALAEHYRSRGMDGEARALESDAAAGDAGTP